MNTVCVNKNKKFLQTVTKFKVTREGLSGCSEDTEEMVLFLLSSFDEKEDTMFCYVDKTWLAGEVQMDQGHLTPTIVVCGKLNVFVFLGLSFILSFVFLYPFLSFLSNWAQIHVAQYFL